MPRRPRNYLKTSYFHVMSQGINRSYIFENPKDKDHYRKIFKEKECDFDLIVINSCIMDNHVHFVIHSEKIEDLSNFMKRINTLYAMYYNKIHNRVGYVFRDRFKSQGIYSEEQLYKCINYVCNNPVKAGLCKVPKDYPYLDCKKDMFNVEAMENMENDELFIDVEDESLSDERIIYDYINNKHLKIEESKEDLRILVKYLKGLNISFRRMEKVLNVSREKLRKIIN